MTGAAILAAMLTWHPAAPWRACVLSRHDRIAHAIDAGAARFGVPAEVLASIAYHESWWGCHPRSGGSWGAPVSPSRRSVAGGAPHAAVALAHGYAACGESWRGAILRFRTGLCREGAVGTPYTDRVLRLVTRLANTERPGC